MGRALSEDDIIQVANNEGVSGNELLALADKEDSNDESTSGAGAVGRFQLLPATFKSVYPTGDITNPRDNAIAAARYYKQGRDKTGTPEDAAAYYYAGPNFQNKVQKAPGVKYGTNPDGSGGISIEDYRNKFSQNLKRYSGNTQPPTTVSNVADAGGITSVPTLSGEPGLAGDLNNSIAAVSLSLNDQADKVVAASQTLGSALKENIAAQMKNLTDQGQLEADITLDKWGQQAKQAAESSAELSRLGINTSDLDNTIAQISVSINEKYDEAMKLRQHIREEQAVGPLDDPIRYFSNIFTLPSEIRQHNAILEDMAAQKGYVDQATSIASSVHAVNASKFTSVSLEGAMAAASLAKTKAAERAIQLQDTMLKTDLDTQVKTLSALKMKQDLMEQSELRQANLAIKKSKLEKDQAEAERIQNDNYQIQTAGNILGMTIPDRKGLEKMPKDVKQAVEYVMENGGIIGKDPMEALQVLRRGNPDKMAANTQQQLRLLNTAYGQAAQTLGNDPEYKVAKPQQRAEMISKKMSETLNLAAADPNYTGLKINPYKIPSIDTMSQLPGVATSRLAVLAGQFKKDFPNIEITDSQLYAIAQANVGPTKVYSDMSDAARDLSKYYQAGVKFNNEKVRFDSFGMPKQEEYRVKLPNGNVDMTSYSGLMTSFLQSQRGRPFLSRARDLGD